MLWFVLGLACWAGEFRDEREIAAEYNRLRNDLRRYAERQMWSAVERTYERCLELYPDPESAPSGGWAPPTPMEQRDHLDAAHASMARGDMYTTRIRVVRAMRKEQTAEALDWLWSIDTTYSEVELFGPVGVELRPVARPFDPVLKRAIAYAAAQLRETGAFHGLLPRMAYQLGEHRFVVEGGRGVVRVDIRSHRERRRAARRTRRGWFRAGL